MLEIGNLKERTKNWDIYAVLWLALLAKCIFSFVFRCQFTPLLIKRLWDPPLLFTPIPSKLSFRLTSYLGNRLFVYGTLKVARFSKRVSVHQYTGNPQSINRYYGMGPARHSQNEKIFSCPRRQTKSVGFLSNYLHMLNCKKQS